MTDEEITAAETRAARELASRLRGHVQNPDGLAAKFMSDLRAEGWRPPLPRPVALEHRGARSADPHTHAAAARAALRPETSS